MHVKTNPHPFLKVRQIAAGMSFLRGVYRGKRYLYFLIKGFSVLLLL